MASPLKYMFDENGEKTSIVVPLRTWKKITTEYIKLQNKLRVLTALQQGIAEVKEAKRTGKKLQPLKDFLSESYS